MRFMSYAASKDDAPETSLRFNRRYVDNRPIGIRARHGMRCWSWVWRTVR
jgi:hypothetical protein